MTIAGPTLVARVASCDRPRGADLGARVRGGRRLATGRSHRLAAGDVVEIPGDPAPGSAPGGRCLPRRSRAAIDVPVVLGSRSTCLAGGFGGLDGRPLRAGDEIVAPPRRSAGPDGPTAGARLARPGRRRRRRVVARPRRRARPRPPRPRRPGSGSRRPPSIAWRVGAAADRVGVRLIGDPLPAGHRWRDDDARRPWGAIQVPPDGLPIVLGADHQATGGYRVVGVVITADRPVLGQLRPGARSGSSPTDRAAAIEALRGAGGGARAPAPRPSATRPAWDALIDAAGG